MELRTSVKTLNYVKNLLLGQTDNILPFAVHPQKPTPKSEPVAIPLPRCTPVQANVPPQALEDFYRTLAADTRLGVHCALVLRHGQVISEGYFAPYSSAYWHVSHSLCKSFTGTAIGMLIDEGALSLSDHICDIFPERCNLLTSRRMRALTVKHLVTMRSGVTFKEIGAVLERDWVGAFFSSDFAFEPGERFDYNSMNSYMLSAIITKKTGLTLYDYLQPRLFAPLGFGPVAWETCPMGITKGGWGMYLMPEDMAKLGQLYLQKGFWNVQGAKRRLVSEAWIDAATKPDSVHENGEEYGYQLWTHSADGCYLFNGMFGQYVAVNPAANMVVVVTAGSGNLFTESPTFAAVQQLFACIQSQKSTAQITAESQASLQFVLAHLRFAQSVPAYDVHPPAPKLKWYQIFWATLQRLWRREALSPALPSASALPRPAYTLDGKTFSFPKNSAGLLPIIISCMSDYYTQGTQSVRFAIEENMFVMYWQEDGNTQRLPVGFDSACVSTVDLGKNVFVAGIQGHFTQDEDNHMVLKLTINYLESSSTRRIKFFFDGDEITAKFNENPSVPFVIQLLQNSNADSFKLGLGIFKDLDYLHFLLERFCSPIIHGSRLAPDDVTKDAPAQQQGQSA